MLWSAAFEWFLLMNLLQTKDWGGKRNQLLTNYPNEGDVVNDQTLQAPEARQDRMK